MDKDPLKPTNLRANLYKIMDEIIRTGESVEVLRHGHKIKLELGTKQHKSLFDKLKPHPNFITPGTTDEDLINTPSKWNYDFS